MKKNYITRSTWIKKTHAFFTVLILLVSTVIAQTPAYFNTNVAAGANVFPLGNTSTSRKVQWFIPPGSLGTITGANFITKVYFQAGSTATNTYPIINIKLKTGSGTGLTGTASGPVEPGMTLVYTSSGQVITATAGGWIGFTLNTPWLYNQALPLIVELEHNSTSATQALYQAVSIPGPGNGRQWADYNVGTITGVGTNQINFGIDIIPATPCSAAPPTNTIVPVSFSTCPGLNNPSISLASTYSLGGLAYQWLSSTTSPVGPFTAIPGATLSSAPVPTLGVTTWYQAVVTCTNTGGSTTLTPTQFLVGGGVTATVPYLESFEGLQVNDRLPNCSWFAANLGTTVTTYTAAANNNRVPRTGNKLAAFGLPSNNNIVYSNGITMSPGITYSAALWYATEYVGYSNWTSLSILIGSSQSSTALTPIATVGPAVSGPYKLLSGVFTVPTNGNYYIAVMATAANGQALYLSWDDLSVTIPCDGAGAANSPTITLSANQTTICSGNQVSLSANGADTYTWSTGANGNAISDNPPVTTTYTVWGSNALTGCTSTLTQLVNVILSPNVLVFAGSPTVCSGQPVNITAIGAASYVWSNGATTPVILVTPTISATYNVIGTSLNGCSNSSSQLITVNPLPNIVPSSSNPGDACKGDLVTLSANGGVNYQWVASSSGLIFQGNPINTAALPVGVTVFTVTGTNANGCAGKNTIAQSVVLCTGINKYASSQSGVRIYPNPTSGEFTVESNSGSVKTIEVIDLTGRVILSYTSTNDHMIINMGTVANGIYYVKVASPDKIDVIKVAKQ